MEEIDKNDVIMQSYIIIQMLHDLEGSNKFSDSEYFNKFVSEPARSSLKRLGIHNNGASLLALYALLVIPKELIEKSFKKEFGNVNEFLRSNAINVKTTYEKEDKNNYSTIDFVRHIRNAVAHANVNFVKDKVVEFKDRKEKWNKKKDEEFSCEIPKQSFGELLNILAKIHDSYLEKQIRLIIGQQALNTIEIV